MFRCECTLQKPIIYLRYAGITNYSISALVDFNKEEFIGRPAATEQSKQKYDRRLALLTFDPADNPQVPLEWKNLPFGNEVVRREGREEVKILKESSSTISRSSVNASSFSESVRSLLAHIVCVSADPLLLPGLEVMFNPTKRSVGAFY